MTEPRRNPPVHDPTGTVAACPVCTQQHPATPTLPHTVVRSQRRRKTVQARLVDGELRLAIPATMSAAEEAHWLAVMQARFERKQHTSSIDLTSRARRLATDLDLPLPTEITWSDRQRSIWGSCTVATGRIRISARLAAYPRWVLDYVIVHELAHLAERRHDDAFWQRVERYPMTERARGYLIAKGEEHL